MSDVRPLVSPQVSATSESWRLPATALSSALERGDASSVEVVRAHLARIDEVEGRVHAFTEVLRESAIAAAEASDARRRRGEALGPLDGVPVSVKECFDVAGRPTTIGLPAWRRRVAREDAALVVALRRAGAVVLGRTNLSQAMLYIEARNPIYGRTANPWSTEHSPGGSSGGEAAAVAAGMSPLGVGTDIGGSIRTPAHFCAVVGLKPSLDRLPMRGYRTVNPGQEGVRAAAGPMARTVADVSLLMRVIDGRATSRLDPRVAPLAWSDPAAVDVRGLRVGVYADDGVLSASASIARAVDRAAAALRARGCDVEPFRPPDVVGAMASYLGALSADGGVAVRAALAGGEVDPSLDLLRKMALMPASMRRAAAGAARAFGQANLALMLDAVGEKTVSELWTTIERLRAYTAEMLGEMGRRELTALICPAYATAALPHGASRGFTLASSYGMIFNVTGQPAGVVPVTRVRSSETTRAPGRDRLASKAAHVDERSAGLPVGVQVVGRPWEDHVVVALMAALEAEVRGDAEFPRTPVDPGS